MRKALWLVTFLGWALFAAGQNYHWLRADIPVDFQFNGQSMQAGLYMFGSDIQAHAICIRNANSAGQLRYQIMEDFDAHYKSQVPLVTFHKIGNQYFFSDLRYPGWGRTSVFPSAVEKRYDKIAKQQVQVQGDEVGK